MCNVHIIYILWNSCHLLQKYHRSNKQCVFTVYLLYPQSLVSLIHVLIIQLMVYDRIFINAKLIKYNIIPNTPKSISKLMLFYNII